MSRFNPVLGFLVVSTSDSLGSDLGFRELFQSRLGFSGRLDAPRFVGSSSFINVSIPSWVFWSSRLRVRSLSELVSEVSIPSWVFWSSRQCCSKFSNWSLVKFQSRLGFSGRLDALAGSVPKRLDEVSIPSWVFWSSRPVGQGIQTPYPTVSIPSWVFWSSRHQGQRLSAPVATGFNPVLGFLVVSTRRTAATAAAGRSFQSRLGFSGRLDCIRRNAAHSMFLSFQSRLGFSGRLD